MRRWEQCGRRASAVDGSVASDVQYGGTDGSLDIHPSLFDRVQRPGYSGDRSRSTQDQSCRWMCPGRRLFLRRIRIHDLANGVVRRMATRHTTSRAAFHLRLLLRRIWRCRVVHRQSDSEQAVRYQVECVNPRPKVGQSLPAPTSSRSRCTAAAALHPTPGSRQSSRDGSNSGSSRPPQAAESSSRLRLARCRQCPEWCR